MAKWLAPKKKKSGEWRQNVQQKLHIGKKRSVINQLEFSMYLQLAEKPDGIRGLVDGTIKNKNLLKNNMKNEEQKAAMQPH